MEQIKITSQDYMKMQPGYPDQYPSDKFYFGVAQELARIASDSAFAARFGADLTRKVVLAVVGYYQDIVSDAGLWRSFCAIHKHLYGVLLPIYPIDDDYVESELNLTDVRLLVWYVTDCDAASRGEEVSPHDADLESLAKALYKPLEDYYDFAPRAEAFDFLGELEIYNPEHAQQVYDFSYWLFWDSYLMHHAAVATMRRSLEEGEQIVRSHPDPDEARPLLLDLNHRVMQSSPTGPLALMTRDWLHAIVDNKMPKSLSSAGDKGDFISRLHSLR